MLLDSRREDKSSGLNGIASITRIPSPINFLLNLVVDCET
jgi:hypothetical protein